MNGNSLAANSYKKNVVLNSPNNHTQQLKTTIVGVVFNMGLLPTVINIIIKCFNKYSIHWACQS